MGDNKDKPIVVDLNHTFHPYENNQLREEQPQTPITNKREPFNDFVKHQELVNGYQRNRTLEDYPRRARK